MNCNSCGANVPEGAGFCPVCGQPVQAVAPQQPVQPQMAPQQPIYQQPVQPQMAPQQPMYQQPVQPQMAPQQPMYQQPMQPQMAPQQPMYQQPMKATPAGAGFDANGFAGALTKDYMKLIKFVSGILLFLSPLFHWCVIGMKYGKKWEKEKFNMFGMNGALKFYAIMFMILGILFIVIELADFIPALKEQMNKIPYLEYIELGLVALALLFFILAFFNGELRDAIHLSKTYGKMLGAKVRAYRGFGSWIGFLGVVGAAFPRVMNLVKKN